MSDASSRAIVDVAGRMLDGDLGLLAGCREIARHRAGVADEDDELFAPLLEVDEEADVRRGMRAPVLIACARIVALFTLT